jgi:hypothetical protein
VLVQELLGNLAEAIAADRAGHLLQAALEARILAVGEQLSGGFAAVPGIG